MRSRILVRAVVGLILVAALTVSDAAAQPLGTFRWQLNPFCNVLTVNVTQLGGVFTLDGFDDLCGADTRGSVTGMAVPNQDGSIGLGLTLVLTPGATPLHIRATVSLATVSGTWVDSAGNSGAFVFNPSIAPGSPRPAVKPVFSAGLSAGNTIITNVANPVSSTDAATKSYVDSTVAASSYWLHVSTDATLRAASPSLAGTLIFRAPGHPAGVYCIRLPSGVPVSFGAVGSIEQQVTGTGLFGFIVVSTTVNTGHCSPIGAWDIEVQTYSAAGTPADRLFTVLIPR